MLLRAVLLCALSPLAFGAGVTIELSNQVSIGNVIYTENDDGWINHDSAKKGLDSFQEVSISHPDVISGVLYEKDDLSLDLLIKDSHLTRKTISRNGYQSTLDYPAIQNDFTRYGLMDGVPYLLDVESDTIWQWDVDYWRDLNNSLGLPNGEYDDLYVIGNHYLLSMTDDVNGGIWQIGLTQQKISDVSLAEDSSFFFTPQGFLQLYKNSDGIFESQWLIGNNPEFFIPLNYDDFSYAGATASSSGTIFNFLSQQYFQLLWLSYDNTLPTYLDLPLGWSGFNGCFSSYPRAFCFVKTEALDYALYEVIDGEFVLDTMLDPSIAGLGIVNIHAVGEHRFITAVTYGSYPKTFSLLSVSGTGTEVILEASVDEDGEFYSIMPSRDPSVFYWLGRETGKTQLYKAKVSGGVDFKRNVEPADQQGKHTDGEANLDGSPDDDSDDGIGSLPVFSSLLLLLLLIPRATRKTR